MAKVTPATRALNDVGISFRLHIYDRDHVADPIGSHATKALNVPPRRLLKTLMAKVYGTPICAIIPTDRDSP